MKVFKNILFFVFAFTLFIANAQTPEPKGTRYNNATEVTTATRIPVMDANGIVNYYISPSNLTGVDINQDNIYRSIDVQATNFTLSNIATAINGLPAFTINDVDIVFFKISKTDNIEGGFIVATLKDLGKGDYGTGNTVLTDENINIISTLPFSISDVEELATTQFIDLGNIGVSEIEDGFNAHTFIGTEDPVQLQEEGYVIINAIQNGSSVQYLFVGPGGEYGTGGTETAVNEDFTLVAESIQPNDLWRDRDGMINMFAYEDWISHDGTVNLGENLYVSGFINGTDRNSTSKVNIRGAYGAEFSGGNTNHAVYRFNTAAPGSVYPGGRGFDNVILSRDYSFQAGNGAIQTNSLRISPTVDFTNTTASASLHRSIYINPTITNLNGGKNYAILSQSGDVEINNGNLKLGNYGDGNETGTATYNLSVDVDGNVIETAIGGGGGTDDQEADEVTSDDASFDVVNGTDVQANLNSIDNELYSSKPVETTDTGTEISLHTSGGNNCNFASANDEVEYTLTNTSILNGWSQILINVSQADLDTASITEPSITGATQEGGIEFTVDTDLYLIVRNKGNEIVYYYLPTTVSSLNTPTTEQIYGTRETANVSTTKNIDWSSYSVFQYTATDDTIFSDVNLPTGAQTKVVEMVLTGDEVLTFPAYWTAMPYSDTYDGTGLNYLVITCINGTPSSEMILYSITNL